MKAVALILALVSGAMADVYMHNPRGSNDRNCERNENRNNGNRLFDSQNNDKGGYACPRAVGGPEVVTPTMYYYAGSRLRIEWTHQHGCNTENVDCEIILQYMCAADIDPAMGDPMYSLLNANIRDGTPTDANDAATDRMEPTNVDSLRYGYHETYAWYQACATRERNEGLWISDQAVATNAQGGSATRTRQNNNGARRGWECPEERDYYPYWHPAPWKDIAVLTSKQSRCQYYKKESQNVAEKFWCVTSGGVPARPNTYGECINSGNNWVAVPSWGVDAPECAVPDSSRDNHLGNTVGGDMVSYTWTLPTLSKTMNGCVLRLRYNISNSNSQWDYDHTLNGANSPTTQDPLVHIQGKDTMNNKEAINMSLALNTNQYGRTFQDRSYVFTIMQRGDGDAGAGTIWNLNVRGKRGNIVQTYPAVEYDFVPQYLTVNAGDYIHFQWTGSDYNPDRTPNNAEGGPTDPSNPGTYRADRSNIVPVVSKKNAIMPDQPSGAWFGTLSREQMISLAYANQDLDNCLTLEQLYQKHSNGAAVNTDAVERDPQNCMKINARTPYFDLSTPVRMTKSGTYHYMSTRNNNFSNRNQRASITVNDELSTTEQAAIGTGAAVGAAGLVGGGAYYARHRMQS